LPPLVRLEPEVPARTRASRGPPTIDAMEIVLVRHGEPEWVRDGFSIDDPVLTERGHRQAAATAQVLGDEHFDEVLCSPLVRARQTAAPLLRSQGREEVVAPWLEEVRNHLFHGSPAERAEEAFKAERMRPSEERWSGLSEIGGEHLGAFVARIREGCGLFLAERGIEPVASEFAIWSMPNPSRRVALVAHAGTNAAVICHLLGLPPVPWEWDRFILNHGSISRLTTVEMGDGHAFALQRLSDVEHLALDDRTL
jgi:2,3-bisphosphoglycerate-dependent phosphoglycerate mutase